MAKNINRWRGEMEKGGELDGGGEGKGMEERKGEEVVTGETERWRQRSGVGSPSLQLLQ